MFFFQKKVRVGYYFDNFIYFYSENQNYFKMNDLAAKIQEAYYAFAKDAMLQAENGNKAAGARARKASLTIEKMMKEFRKLSLEESKK